MMKWGRKKTFQTTSSTTLMSSVSLKNWTLRFKKMKDGAEHESRNTIRIDNWYENEDMNSDYRLNVSPVSSRSFKKMMSNGRSMREFINEEERLGRIALKEHKSREEKTVEKVVYENKPKTIIQKTSHDIHNSRTERSKLDSSLEEEWQKLKRMKINEIMLKNEKQKNCIEASIETPRRRSKQGYKVNGYTPRIKALEDMKKTRMKMNKEKAIKDAFRTYLDSYAIIKRSYDPQQDFRDSMIEMIIENGIRQREEFEELLACYLTLNCDAYHHIIVKVFQEVWLELNKVKFDPYFNF